MFGSLAAEAGAVEDERLALMSEVEKLDKRASSLQKLMEGYIELYPDLEDISRHGPPSPSPPPAAGSQARKLDDPGSPGTRDRIRALLKDAGGSWLTVREIESRLRGTGWTTKSQNPVAMLRNEMAGFVKREPEMYERRTNADHTVHYRCRPPDPPVQEPSFANPLTWEAN